MINVAIWFAFFIALTRTLGWISTYLNVICYALQRNEDGPGLMPNESWLSLATTAAAWTIFLFGVTSGS